MRSLHNSVGMNYTTWLTCSSSTTRNENTTRNSGICDAIWQVLTNVVHNSVFYGFGKGCSKDAKELDRFEWCIREIYIDCMVFGGWFKTKSICYFNFISGISNDYNENGMLFIQQHRLNTLILLIFNSIRLLWIHINKKYV